MKKICLVLIWLLLVSGCRAPNSSTPTASSPTTQPASTHGVETTAPLPSETDSPTTTAVSVTPAPSQTAAAMNTVQPTAKPLSTPSPSPTLNADTRAKLQLLAEECKGLQGVWPFEDTNVEKFLLPCVPVGWDLFGTFMDYEGEAVRFRFIKHNTVDSLGYLIDPSGKDIEFWIGYSGMKFVDSSVKTLQEACEQNPAALEEKMENYTYNGYTEKWIDGKSYYVSPRVHFENGSFSHAYIFILDGHLVNINLSNIENHEEIIRSISFPITDLTKL